MKRLRKTFIEYNIDYTRKLLILMKLKKKNYNITNNLTTQDIKDNKDIISNIKIMRMSSIRILNNQFQIYKVTIMDLTILGYR